MRKSLMLAWTVCRSTSAQLPQRRFDAHERPWLWDVFCKVVFFFGGGGSLCLRTRQPLHWRRWGNNNNQAIVEQTEARQHNAVRWWATTGGHKMFPASRYSSRGEWPFRPLTGYFANVFRRGRRKRSFVSVFFHLATVPQSTTASFTWLPKWSVNIFNV